jgi:hypothetical protein
MQPFLSVAHYWEETPMSIKTFVIAAAVVAGTFGLTDRADAQWRRYAGYNSYPTYNYVAPAYSTYSYPAYSYSPGAVYSGYSYPSYYTTSGVVTSGVYADPYTSGVVTSGYYADPYASGVYTSPYYGTGYMDPYTAGMYNSYYSGYSNLGGNPYGISVGTRGGMIAGRRAWRW